MEWVIGILGTLVLCFVWPQKMKVVGLIAVGVAVAFAGLLVGLDAYDSAKRQRTAEQRVIIMRACLRVWVKEQNALQPGEASQQIEVAGETFTLPEKPRFNGAVVEPRFSGTPVQPRQTAFGGAAVEQAVLACRTKSGWEG